GPHTTSDNPRVYRSAEYEAEQNKKCPILRLEKWMLANGVISQSEIDGVNSKIQSELEEANNVMESKKAVTIDEIFDYTYAENYEELKEQKAEAKRIFGEK
nr:hypothetical protein [Malacoplasma sp.]